MHQLGSELFLILGNQLFASDELVPFRHCRFFMAEDIGLCTYVRHHKQKLVLFLAAMRSYRDLVREQGYTLDYFELGDPQYANLDYEQKLAHFIETNGTTRLLTWEIEDAFFEARLRRFAAAREIPLRFVPSPMFLTSRKAFAEWLADKTQPQMASFYSWQRRRLDILVDGRGRPVGGRWSLDRENRRPLPRDEALAPPSKAAPTEHARALISVVNDRFSDHPGVLSERSWWLPTSREQVIDWLEMFIASRLERFGPFEDALSSRDDLLFHSALTPMLNLGLLTPREVLDRVLAHADAHRIPLNSLEGFVRQVIGWREFIRGIEQNFGRKQRTSNFFRHDRKLTDAWYQASTGLRPLDDAIAKASRLGWTHHIERLMVLGNLMLLCEVHPDEAYRWFMEMFVDSADWVMGPNVYGMALFSDGGIFASKPYICGSNYILKMSDYPRPKSASPSLGGTWCEVMDGLYWRFVDKHRGFFAGQARMSQMVGLLDRMKRARKQRIFALAERFILAVTY